MTMPNNAFSAHVVSNIFVHFVIFDKACVFANCGLIFCCVKNPKMSKGH